MVAAVIVATAGVGMLPESRPAVALDMYSIDDAVQRLDEVLQRLDAIESQVAVVEDAIVRDSLLDPGVATQVDDIYEAVGAGPLNASVEATGNVEQRQMRSDLGYLRRSMRALCNEFVVPCG